MKRVLKWMVVVGAGYTGASLFARRRKQAAWENEPRGAAEFPPLEMEQPTAPSTTAEGASGNGSRQWVKPLGEGDCPGSHPIKAKKRSGIYHVDGNFAYDRTKADRCYLNAEAAEADGFRAAKN